MSFKGQFQPVLDALAPVTAVINFIWKVIYFLFVGMWARTSFFYKILYGIFWTTLLSAGLWYFVGYLVGNLYGIEDPWVSFPMFPWLIGIFTGSAGLPHFPGDKIDFIQYTAAWVLLLIIIVIPRYFYPKKGLASGRVSKVQFVAFHVALSGIVGLCFVQWHVPAAFFGMFN